MRMGKRFIHYVLLSVVMSLVVFIFSFLNNTFLTSLIRAGFGLVFFTFGMLPVLWFLRRVLRGPETTDLAASNTSGEKQPTGHHIDLITPEEEISLHANEKDTESEFIPWIPGEGNADREDNAKKIAQSLSLFSDDKGR